MSLVANELGVSRQAVHDRVNRSPRMRSVLAEVKETILDMGEGHVIKAMQGDKERQIPPDLTTNRWYLERQGGARGYANKTQVETKLADGELGALVTAFGGDIKKLRAFRDSLDPSKAGQP